MSAGRRLDVLHNEWHACTRCGLSETRLSDEIFFGFGSPTPKYVIVGSTPSNSDEMFSSMFSGDPGTLLFQLLEDCGIRQEECYFTYSLSCRPTVTIPATDTEQERVENREPAKEELVACRPRLYEQIYQTDPRAIIAFGEIATKAVIRGRIRKFLDAQGKQYTMLLPKALHEDHAKQIMGKARWFDIVYPVFAVPEMTTILNNPSEASHGPLAIAIRTIERAKRYVEFVMKSELKTMKE